MDDIDVECLSCHEKIQVWTEWAGETITCPTCKGEIIIPEAAKMLDTPQPPITVSFEAHQSVKFPQKCAGCLTIRIAYVSHPCYTIRQMKRTECEVPQ